MDRFVKNSAKLLAFTTALATATGCTTLFKKSASDEFAAQRGKEVAGDVIVQQPQVANPVISPYSRDYWLSVRAGDKAGVRQMYAILATGDWQNAVSHARAWLKKNPGDIDGLTVMAAGQALGRRYDLAAYYARLIEKNYPNNADAQNILGLSAMVAAGNRLADYQRAISYFQKAHDLSGKQIAAGLNLGHLQLELGNAKAARLVFADVAGRCDDCSTALLGLGIAASRNREYAEAESAFNKILSKNPNHSGATFHLALLHKNGYNNKKQAEALLQKLLANRNVKDRYVKERASAVLRQFKAEDERSPSTAVAGTDANKNSSVDEAVADEMLIMSSGTEEDQVK